MFVLTTDYVEHEKRNPFHVIRYVSIMVIRCDVFPDTADR